MDKIFAFAREIEKRCKERDTSATVEVHTLRLTMNGAEYRMVIHSNCGVDVYDFDPFTGEWFIVYVA